MKTRAALAASAAAAFAAFAAALFGAGAPVRAADMVCASTSSQGLICLDAAGFRQYTRRGGQLPDDSIADLAVCGGTVYFAAGEQTATFDGTTFGRPVNVGRGLVERISCNEKGGL